MALRDRVLEEESIAIIDRRWRDGPLRIEPANRRIRVFFADKAIADSFRALLQMEDRHLPVYYFPREDVRMDLTEPSNTRTTSPHKGEATYRSIRVGDRTSNDAMWIYEDPVAGAEALAAHVAFYWDKVDAWYEEDDEVFVHPRDPYHRVDVLHSSRHVWIQVGGETIAETTRARLLFETGLPTRYYIPKLDVRMERLRPSAKHTRCPYKGVASYWDIAAGDRMLGDLVWSYPEPIPECPKIENLLCFFNEHADIYVDGELQPKPLTPWS